MLKVASTMARFSTFQLPPVNHKPQPYNGPSFEQVYNDRKAYIPHFHFLSYKVPLLITEGWMQYLYDHKGDRYLDLISGISTVSCGHCHPAITKVVREQAGTLVHSSSIFLNHWPGEYCKQLAQLCGPDYDSVYLCNSGGEANDFAVYMSRLFTGQYSFSSLDNCYHGLVGNAYSTIAVPGWKGRMLQDKDFHLLPSPSAYRSEWNNVDEYIEATRKQLKKQSPSGKIAGFMWEPIQGVGGISVHRDGYLKKITDMMRDEFGALLISDEVQTGFGRIGPEYWGHKWQGVKPDIITMAKGIGNGYPLGAVVTSKRVTNKLSQLFFNTYGGGPIQSRVGLEVIRIIREEKLAENAEKVGNYLLAELKKVADKSEHLGDVRGKGLMVGIELVKNKEKKEADGEGTAKFMELLKERRILVGKGGAGRNVVRIQPPLCMSLEDAKHTVWAFEDSLKHMKE